MQPSIGNNNLEHISRSVVEDIIMDNIKIDTFKFANRHITIAYCYEVNATEDRVEGFYGYAIHNPEDKFIPEVGESLALGRLGRQSKPRFQFSADDTDTIQDWERLFNKHMESHLNKIANAIIEFQFMEMFRDIVTREHDKEMEKIASEMLPEK